MFNIFKNNKKKMNLVREDNISPIHIMSGDKLILFYEDAELKELIFEEEFTKALIINNVKLYSFENDFGMQEGFAIVCGKRSRNVFK